MARRSKMQDRIVIDVNGILMGTINFRLPLSGQMIWVKMIAFAKICGGRVGYIEDNSGHGVPVKHLAHMFHATEEEVQTVIEAMIEDAAIEITDSGSIHLVNYKEYQPSDYYRQRDYRQGQAEAEKLGSGPNNKKPFGELKNVMLSQQEYDALVKKFGEKESAKMIDNLSLRLSSKGYKYKSHYATLLTWKRMDEDKKPKSKFEDGWR